VQTFCSHILLHYIQFASYKKYTLKLYIKYMVSIRCKMAVKDVLKNLGLHFIIVDLGEVEIMEDLDNDLLDKLKKSLIDIGLELMDDHKAILIEKTKNVITDMIHNSDEVPKVNYSDYISEKLDYDYTYLSNIFSEVKGITIQHFIIIHKIERIKELIIYDQLSISEIAWKMNYSSVAHLSNQFKKMTGLTPSHYKQLKNKRRKPIEEIGNTSPEKHEINLS
jgi:AraC-like DNA-binding protein